MSAISEEVATRLVGHVRDDTTDMAASDLRVPIRNFVDEGHVAAERALFKRLPLIVALGSEVAEPGSFLTRDVLGTSVIITRQSDGTVATFLNMCRHRGGKVESKPSGAKRVFVCQYHGWAYDRDGGTLRNVPYEEFFEPIDHGCNGLVRVKTEERHGFIWVDFSNDPDRTVAEYLGPKVAEQLDAFELDGAQVFLDKTFELDVNWKLVVDGAIDILHPKFLHPNGVGKLFQTNAGAWEDYGRHGQLFTARKRLADLAKSGQPVDAAWKYFATNLVVYPNSMVIAAPDHVEFWSVWPSTETASRSITNIRFLVRPEILTDDMAARLLQSWEILGAAAQNEDWPMEASIQANSQANPDGTYLYGRNEIPCQHLHRQLAEDLAGEAG